MLSIKINNEFLDLPANAGFQLIRNNPYINPDRIDGEFSLGLTLNYSERNLRLLQFNGIFSKLNNKITIDASIYDDNLFRYGGTLVVNTYNGNMNKIESIVWNCLFTIGASSFLQSIQGQLLQYVDFGGKRSFPFTTDDPNDGSNGFWQMIHDARIPNRYPYTFFPVYNDRWDSDHGNTWMNKIRDDNYFFSHRANNTNHNFTDANVNSLCPAIYVNYIITQIFNQYGWKVAGDVVTDAGYNKLVLQSFKSIFWVIYFLNSFGEFDYSNNDVVHFDIADYVDQSITVGSFITNLMNRFGWFFDFDSTTKTVYIRSLKSIISGAVKDWTSFATAPYLAEFIDATKIYSLVNDVDSEDDYPVLLTIDERYLLPAAASFANIPDPSSVQEGSIIFCFYENQYYQSNFDSGTSVYSWAFYSHNIGDYTPFSPIQPPVRNSTLVPPASSLPEGSIVYVSAENKFYTNQLSLGLYSWVIYTKDYFPDTQDTPIESTFSTMPVNLISHRPGYNGFFPICQVAGNYTTPTNDLPDSGLRILLYHGMVSDINADGSTTGALPYPYASCHCQSVQNITLGNWSIPYRHQYGAINDGVYDYWYKDWLKLLAIQDFRTFILSLPVTELAKFNFGDRIYIANVFFIVTTWTENLPYTGTVQLKMKRIY